MFGSLKDESRRRFIAADAVAEAEAAVRERRGLGAMSAQVGFATIHMVRPGFLVRHVHAMLPDLAQSIEPIWQDGSAAGNAGLHIEANAGAVVDALLSVTDAYVASASDRRAIAVYTRLRPAAPHRIAEHMPRLAAFLLRHSSPP